MEINRFPCGMEKIRCMLEPVKGLGAKLFSNSIFFRSCEKVNMTN